MFTEEDYKNKIKILEKDIKKYRIMNNQKNLKIKVLKEMLSFYIRKDN